MLVEEFRLAINKISPNFQFNVDFWDDKVGINLQIKNNPKWPRICHSRSQPIIKLIQLSNLITTCPEQYRDMDFTAEMAYINDILNPTTHLCRDMESIVWFNRLFNTKFTGHQFEQVPWWQNEKHRVEIALPVPHCVPDSRQAELQIIDSDDSNTMLNEGPDSMSSIIIFAGQGNPPMNAEALHCRSASTIVWILLSRLAKDRQVGSISRNAYNAYCCLFNPTLVSDAWFRESYPTLPVPRLTWERVYPEVTYNTWVFTLFIHYPKVSQL